MPLYWISCTHPEFLAGRLMYPGPPSKERIQQILGHTAVSGRQYWRRTWSDGWRRLTEPEDFAALNRVLEATR